MRCAQIEYYLLDDPRFAAADDGYSYRVWHGLAAWREMFSYMIAPMFGVPTPEGVLLYEEGRPLFGSRVVHGVRDPLLAIERICNDCARCERFRALLSRALVLDLMVRNDDRHARNLALVEGRWPQLLLLDFGHTAVGDRWLVEFELPGEQTNTMRFYRGMFEAIGFDAKSARWGLHVARQYDADLALSIVEKLPSALHPPHILEPGYEERLRLSVPQIVQYQVAQAESIIDEFELIYQGHFGARVSFA